MTWRLIRQKLSKCSERDLLGLVGDLYKLNKENQRFLQVRFSTESGNLDLAPFKDIISKNVCPEPPRPLRLSVAKKAISNFKKATGNVENIVELMVYYVEQGVKFTSCYGDIDEPFYASLESMFDNVIKQLQKNELLIDQFLPRLKKIVYDTRHMGWGFHDYLGDVLDDAFSKSETIVE